MKIINTIFLLTIITVFVDSQLVGDQCTRKYDNARGICRNHRDCRRVREDYDRGIPITYCAYLGSHAVVCCPESESDTPKPRIRISAEKCKEYEKLTYDRFQGEFPHMVAIGWRRLSEISFDCGGSLISNRHVLTAAHCEKSGNVGPSFVRLGDHSIFSKSDGLNEVDIDIANFIKHPQYSTRTLKNDIAIIEMVRSVNFTDNIRPACLWQEQNLNISKVIATGWGYVGYASPQSEDLLKVELDVIEQNQCNNLIEEKLSLSREKLTDRSQLCAGVLSGGRDTCGGDSGGPVQVTLPGNQCLHHIVAITSFGAVFCGFPQTPAVYSRVSAFLDFIEDNVWRK